MYHVAEETKERKQTRSIDFIYTFLKPKKDWFDYFIYLTYFICEVDRWRPINWIKWLIYMPCWYVAEETEETKQMRSIEIV